MALDEQSAVRNELELPGRLAERAKPFVGAGSMSFAPPSSPALRLTGGVPEPSTFPLDELAEACRVVLKNAGDVVLQYGGFQGTPGLREFLAGYIMGQEGIELTAGNFMLTGGASQALASVCFAFLDPGDVVVAENPTFTLSIRTFRAHQAEIAGVPLDHAGPDIDALAAALDRSREQGKRVKLIYLTPNFQNPTGISFSLERRQSIIDLARRHNCLVVEDDAYGELRYDSERIPSLFTLAGGEGVIRLGTFSKTMGPGLRLGWTLANQETTQALVAMRQDMGTSPFLSGMIETYAAEGRYERHVEEIIGYYRTKRDAMLSALERYCSSWARWQSPEGGFFVWLELLDGLNGERVAEAALEEGVMVVPGANFFCAEPKRNYLRLSYSYAAMEEIEEAIRRLAAAFARVES